MYEKINHLLLENLEPHFKELTMVWNDIGLSECQLEARFDIVNHHICNLLNEMVKEEKGLLVRLTENISTYKNKIDNLCSVLNIENIVIKPTSIVELEKELRLFYEQLSKERDHRMSRWKELCDIELQISSVLKTPIHIPTYKHLPKDSDVLPSFEEMNLYEDHLKCLEKEKIKREIEFKHLKINLLKLSKDLEYKCKSKSESDILNENFSMDLSIENLAIMKALLQKMERLKDENINLVANLKAKLYSRCQSNGIRPESPPLGFGASDIAMLQDKLQLSNQITLDERHKLEKNLNELRIKCLIKNKVDIKLPDVYLIDEIVKLEAYYNKHSVLLHKVHSFVQKLDNLYGSYCNLIGTSNDLDKVEKEVEILREYCNVAVKEFEEDGEPFLIFGLKYVDFVDMRMQEIRTSKAEFNSKKNEICKTPNLSFKRRFISITPTKIAAKILRHDEIPRITFGSGISYRSPNYKTGDKNLVIITRHQKLTDSPKSAKPGLTPAYVTHFSKSGKPPINKPSLMQCKSSQFSSPTKHLKTPEHRKNDCKTPQTLKSTVKTRVNMDTVKVPNTIYNNEKTPKLDIYLKNEKNKLDSAKTPDILKSNLKSNDYMHSSKPSFVKKVDEKNKENLVNGSLKCSEKLVLKTPNNLRLCSTVKSQYSQENIDGEKISKKSPDPYCNIDMEKISKKLPDPFCRNAVNLFQSAESVTSPKIVKKIFKKKLFKNQVNMSPENIHLINNNGQNVNLDNVENYEINVKPINHNICENKNNNKTDFLKTAKSLSIKNIDNLTFDKNNDSKYLETDNDFILKSLTKKSIPNFISGANNSAGGENSNLNILNSIENGHYLQGAENFADLKFENVTSHNIAKESRKIFACIENLNYKILDDIECIDDGIRKLDNCDDHLDCMDKFRLSSTIVSPGLSNKENNTLENYEGDDEANQTKTYQDFTNGLMNSKRSFISSSVSILHKPENNMSLL